MSETKTEEQSFRNIQRTEQALLKVKEITSQIKRDRAALMDSFKATPDTTAQKKNVQSVVKKLQESKEQVDIPLTVQKKKDKVAIQRALFKQDIEGMHRNVQLSGQKQIQEVFYGDNMHPRSLSPNQLPKKELIIHEEGKEGTLHHSTIVSRVNRNSLTPTKITFSYQNNPSNTVAYVKNTQQIITQEPREGIHLKQSLIREVIVRTPSPPAQKIIRQVTPTKVESRLITISSSSLERLKRQDPSRCRIQASGKRCKLCELTRSQLRGVRQMRFSHLVSSAPREVEICEEDHLQAEPQVQVINNSAIKVSNNRYLRSEDKHQCQRSLSPENGEPEEKAKFNLKFMQSMEIRKKQMDIQLEKLNAPAVETPIKVTNKSDEELRNSTKTRKKIFQSTSSSHPYIRIEDGKRPGYLAPSSRSVAYVRGSPKEKTYSQIHQSEIRNTSPIFRQRALTPPPIYQTQVVSVPVYNEKVAVAAPAPVHSKIIVTTPPVYYERAISPELHSKVVVGPPQQIYFTRNVSPMANQRVTTTAPVYVERMVVPSPKSKVISQEVESSKLQYGLMSDRAQFFKGRENEAGKSDIIKAKLIDINSLSGSPLVREWCELNKKDIDYQTERIFSYDLIKRYMTDAEISARLHKLLMGMVDPKKWLLMMVDEVYAKLKDRYLPLHS